MNYGAFDFRSLSRFAATLGVVFAVGLPACDGGDDDGGDSNGGTTAPTTTADGTSDDGMMTDEGMTDEGMTDEGMTEDGMDESAGAECMEGLSHATDIQPIWDMYCVEGCHVAGGEWPTFDLSMDAFDDIVSVASMQNQLMNQIEPMDPETSYLLHKMLGTQVDVNGSGLNMPKAPLGMTEPAVVPDTDLATIRCWIEQGAAM